MSGFSAFPVLIASLLLLAGCGQEAAQAPDWNLYRGDLAGTGYSSLAQVNRENVGLLEPAWEYSLRGTDGGANSQVTPIIAGDVMYFPAADRIVALDPVSGREIWVRQIEEGRPSRRGVAWLPGDGDNPARILFMAGSNLHAIDASSGADAAGFGAGGTVDIGVPYNSVPLIVEGVVIVGANTPPGQPGGVGNPRAFDVRTGELLWEFASVAQPGDPANASWAGDSWRGRLGANAWPFYFTADPERGMVFLPLASPIPFAWGGDRAGDNLYANAIVAVNLHSGEYIWHFQTIHHDLWDHDPPAPPSLFELEDGTPAMAFTTKSGYLFVLNRDTGEPIHEIIERPVPASEVPGEQTSPIQPVPSAPADLARTRFGMPDLVSATDTNAAHAAACGELLDSLGEVINLGPYTPWVHRTPDSPPRTTLLFPGLAGGPNWGGVAIDRATNVGFVLAANLGTFGWLEQAEDQSWTLTTPRPSGFDVAMGDSRWPCQKPPWGQLSAVDLASGDVLWQQPLGITEGLPEALRNTGRPGRAGAVVTAGGLLFIAATDDNRFRALDAGTGAELWQSSLPGRGNANPMTYAGADGNQYVAIAATDTLLAFSLPD